jgi:hypothetical protein
VLLRIAEAEDGSQRPGSKVDMVTRDFGALLKVLKLNRPGRNFYSLRRATETIGGESRDQVALDRVMGHADPSMGAVYRLRIGDDRLVAVAETVRSWLWPKPSIGPATIPFQKTCLG